MKRAGTSSRLPNLTVASVHGTILEKGNSKKGLSTFLIVFFFSFRRHVGEEKSGPSLASFVLQDDPLSFAVSRPAAEDDPVVLVAVSVTGILHVYEHHLNG